MSKVQTWNYKVKIISYSLIHVLTGREKKIVTGRSSMTLGNEKKKKTFKKLGYFIYFNFIEMWFSF